MNATKRDYYEILSVSRDCDDAGLKSAYRKLALKYHPDRNPNDQDAEERFKEAAEAYSIWLGAFWYFAVKRGAVSVSAWLA